MAIGSVIGLLVVNYISDHKGRRVSILTIQIVAIIGFAGKSNHIKWRSLERSTNMWSCCWLVSFCVGLVVILWCYRPIFTHHSAVRRSSDNVLWWLSTTHGSNILKQVFNVHHLGNTVLLLQLLENISFIFLSDPADRSFPHHFFLFGVRP